MTREEKQKAINALKISAPIMVVTQEEFKDYIQTLNKIMDWLEQESVIDKIRAEIAELSHYYPMGHDYQIAITRCIAVIDKYKAESEAADGKRDNM